MRLWTGVCLIVGGLGLGGCDAPPQEVLARAGLAPAAAPSPEDCGCDGEACPEAAAQAGARPAEEAAVYRRVNVDGAPTALIANGALRDADPRDHEEALVTVAVFSDYQCPYCGRGDGTLQEVAGEYGNRLRVVMKQLPLSFHPHARQAAMAALAAGEQGRYWEMHQRLFANRKALDPASLEGHAQALGLNLARFKEALANPALSQRIDRDLAEAKALGVRGTPAFFINGRAVEGARSASVLKKVIDEELLRAERLVASGVPRSKVYAQLMEQAEAQ